MKAKKVLLVLIVLVMTFTLIFSGCNAQGNDEQTAKKDESNQESSQPQEDASEPKEGDKAQKVTKITIGVSPFQDTLLPVIAQEKGWFEEAGLEVSFETLAWNAILPAIASDSVDIAVYNTTGVIAGYEQMNDLVFLYPWNIFTEGQALMGRSDESIKTAEDFEAEGMSHKEAVKAVVDQMRDKTIITTMGSDMGKAIVEVTNNNGLTEDDYTIIDMDPDQGLAAFISGSGDFYLGGIPQRTRLEQEGYATLLVGPDLAPVPINGWVTKTSFAENNEDALLRLQNVMFKVIRYTRENTQEIGQIITDKLNSETGAAMSIDDFIRFFNQIEDYTGNASEVARDILSEDGFAYWKRTWDNDNKYFFEVDKLIPEKVPYSAFLAESFQEKYIEKYGADEEGY